MNVSNCKGCGRLFNVISNEKLCPACRKQLDDKFQQVKQYLEEHHNASVNEVAEMNEVSVKQIKQWIREERLVLSESTVDGITCEQCGKPIVTGRFCEKCKSKIANNLSSALNRPVQPSPVKKTERDGDRMRFI